MTDPKTALIYDSCAVIFTKIQEQTDIALSAVEFGLGAPTVDRAIDLGYGLIPLNTNSLTGPNIAPITLSKGIVRLSKIIDLENVTNPVTELKTVSQNSPVTLNILADALGTKTVQDCYVFGSLFLIAVPSANSVGDIVVGVKDVYIVPIFACGGVNGSGDILLPRRDFSIHDAVDCLQTENVKVNVNDISFPLIKFMSFVISIDHYDGTNANKTTIAEVRLLDERKPRGWGGFGEETMACTLVPFLVNNETDVIKKNDTLANAFKSFVSAWIHSSWNPDFVTYWNGSPEFPLPKNIKTYINQNFSLTYLN